jgi:hypothetical protein
MAQLAMVGIRMRTKKEKGRESKEGKEKVMAGEEADKGKGGRKKTMLSGNNYRKFTKHSLRA